VIDYNYACIHCIKLLAKVAPGKCVDVFIAKLYNNSHIIKIIDNFYLKRKIMITHVLLTILSWLIIFL